MSVIFVVTPVVAAGGWPLLLVAAAASAATLGLKALKSEALAREEVAERSVALDMENVEAAASGVRADDRIVFGGNGLKITVARDARGKVTAHVTGTGRSDTELREVGETFLKRVMQQYAYQKVAVELKQKGFKIVQERVGESQEIRIRFRRQA